MTARAQMGLFDRPLGPTVQPRRAMPGESLQAQFEAFHEANPHVFEALRALALQLRSRGHRRIGMKMLFEVLRWEHAMTTNDPASEFKLNNNYTSFYARLLMERDSRLRDAFETRTQRAAL